MTRSQIIIGAIVIVVLLIVIVSVKKSKGNKRKAPDNTVQKQPKEQSSSIKELMDLGYNLEEATQISQSQLYHSGHGF